jgi:hypothetical protein
MESSLERKLLSPTWGLVLGLLLGLLLVSPVLLLLYLRLL